MVSADQSIHLLWGEGKLNIEKKSNLCQTIYKVALDLEKQVNEAQKELVESEVLVQKIFELYNFKISEGTLVEKLEILAELLEKRVKN